MKFYDITFFVDFHVKVYDSEGILLYCGDYFDIPDSLFSDLSNRLVKYISLGNTCFYITLDGNLKEEE